MSPLSPVRAKVIITSSLLEKDVDPDKNVHSTSKYPDCSIISVIVKIAKLEASNLLLILKWPFNVLVLSLIVRRNTWTSIAPSLLSSMYSADARERLELLNLNFPVPGSEFTVDESNV